MCGGRCAANTWPADDCINGNTLPTPAEVNRGRLPWNQRTINGPPGIQMEIKQVSPVLAARREPSASAIPTASIRCSAEYKPERLARGALAIVGDAAHVVSPMTGRGFATGVEDAAVLAQMLADRRANEPVSAALARYEVARLPFVRALVTHSRRISADYLRYAQAQK